MFTHWPDFPAIHTEHMLDARLYADRDDLIRGLSVPEGGKIAEIGVWRAAFSKVLVGELKPRSFFAFDIFTGHLETDWHGMTGAELFDNLSHRQFYEREMAPFSNVTHVVDGPSQETLQNYADHSFDLVYIDGNHNYDFVKSDAELAEKMVAERGFMVFNDYILLSPDNVVYGVVPVVNDLVVNRGWRVVGFALHSAMFCDIALRRPAPAA